MGAVYAIQMERPGFLDLGASDIAPRVERELVAARAQLADPEVQRRVAELGQVAGPSGASLSKIDLDGDNMSIMVAAGTTLLTDLSADPILAGPVFRLLREMDRGAQRAVGLVGHIAGGRQMRATSRAFLHPAGGGGLRPHKDGTFLTVVFRPAGDRCLEVWVDEESRFVPVRSKADKAREASAVVMWGDVVHRVAPVVVPQRVVLTVFIDIDES